ncbi:hypothetical protein ROLI_044600 [Roseobacter fucihabitans]|uniref:PEP-CTERM sorting domain-containing protein n=1 Tax=Roseobacter fucihabitans TaxID=1537242 RepID=A0ABZ2BZ44_9RHOB|nr:hypothetical protein [Roseobacter litoralis]MBC6963939.1 hypothetical protein [Roseobacter litoralis]MBC6963976.1 hypothetical protein [Roseobacter litoralis]
MLIFPLSFYDWILMRFCLLPLIALLSFVNTAWAATFDFDVVARIDSAFLRPASQDAKVPIGGTLFGRMTYSFPPSRQSGNSYEYNSGLETLSISTQEGFSLTLDNRFTVVSSVNNQDNFIAQSFISEDPNGWNMIFEILTIGWLGGATELPSRFPTTFDTGYISAYFLDELDVIQSVEASILSITPVTGPVTPVPIPPTFVLMGTLMLIGLGRLSFDNKIRMLAPKTRLPRQCAGWSLADTARLVLKNGGFQPIRLKISHASRRRRFISATVNNFLSLTHNSEELLLTKCKDY